MDPKLQVSAEVEVFEGRNHNYILVSLMNITDIYDYITEYSTFSFSVCTFSSERHILAIPKSMILLLIVLMKYILLLLVNLLMPGIAYITPAGMDYPKQRWGGVSSPKFAHSILPTRSLGFREGVAKQLGSSSLPHTSGPEFQLSLIYFN